MEEFKVGQTVWFHYQPGDIRHGQITSVDKDGICGVNRTLRWWDSADLYASREEAKAALSPDGQRMAGCIKEARRIRDNGTYTELSDILRIAFKLFDAGGRRS